MGVGFQEFEVVETGGVHLEVDAFGLVAEGGLGAGKALEGVVEFGGGLAFEAFAAEAAFFAAAGGAACGVF